MRHIDTEISLNDLISQPKLYMVYTMLGLKEAILNIKMAKEVYLLNSLMTSALLKCLIYNKYSLSRTVVDYVEQWKARVAPGGGSLCVYAILCPGLWRRE